MTVQDYKLLTQHEHYLCAISKNAKQMINQKLILIPNNLRTTNMASLISTGHNKSPLFAVGNSGYLLSTYVHRYVFENFSFGQKNIIGLYSCWIVQLRCILLFLKQRSVRKKFRFTDFKMTIFQCAFLGSINPTETLLFSK